MVLCRYDEVLRCYEEDSIYAGGERGFVNRW